MRLRGSVGSVPALLNPRLVAPHGVVGVSSWMSYAWIIRTAQGAALVDTGHNPRGTAVLRELARMGLTADDVHHVLLTHGHIDHWAAAGRFRRARVVVGAGDAPIIRGERQPGSLGGRIAHWLTPAVAPPERLEELEGEQTLDVDGEPVRFIPLPGHTPGSGAYLYRDLLFTGDSLNRWRESAVDYATRFYTDDPEQNRASVGRLEAIDFSATADGHKGVAQQAKAKLRRLLHPAPGARSSRR